MKIYFFENGSCDILGFSNPNDEPECLASFELGEEDSHFAPRYSLENKKPVDKYPGKSDEEVAKILQDAESKKAKDLEEKLNPK